MTRLRRLYKPHTDDTEAHDAFDPVTLWRRNQSLRNWLYWLAVVVMLLLVVDGLNLWNQHLAAITSSKRTGSQVTFQCAVERRLHMPEVDCHAR